MLIDPSQWISCGTVEHRSLLNPTASEIEEHHGKSDPSQRTEDTTPKQLAVEENGFYDHSNEDPEQDQHSSQSSGIVDIYFDH